MASNITHIHSAFTNADSGQTDLQTTSSTNAPLAHPTTQGASAPFNPQTRGDSRTSRSLQSYSRTWRMDAAINYLSSIDNIVAGIVQVLNSVGSFSFPIPLDLIMQPQARFIDLPTPVSTPVSTPADQPRRIVNLSMLLIWALTFVATVVLLHFIWQRFGNAQ